MRTPPWSDEVRPGLDGDDGAFRQHVLGRRGEHRGLVDVETDAVAGRVRERRGETGLRERLAAGLVDRPPGHAGRDGDETGALGGRDGGEKRGVGGRRLADADRAGHVRVVAVEDGAEVHDDEVAGRR